MSILQFQSILLALRNPTCCSGPGRVIAPGDTVERKDHSMHEAEVMYCADSSCVLKSVLPLMCLSSGMPSTPPSLRRPDNLGEAEGILDERHTRGKLHAVPGSMER
jgi:hypothetical protein